ncbi:kinase-like domain-containing protein [Aspergillus cavernicola]|uniref:Kinase-like domain-containing protein n=1 Tax=Aspergillus cavernicola TaxID=176166 RepID=A0ABR4HGM1_9EURO
MRILWYNRNGSSSAFDVVIRHSVISGLLAFSFRPFRFLSLFPLTTLCALKSNQPTHSCPISLPQLQPSFIIIAPCLYLYFFSPSLSSLLFLPSSVTLLRHHHSSLSLLFLPPTTTPTMSTIQSLKNFIRHGKQARLVTPHAEPTTNISAVHAEQERQPQGSFSPAAGNLDAIDSKMGSGQPQPSHRSSPEAPKRAREAEIEQIIAEEKSNRSKMPNYPGLERWVLVEKMGDGAFSNVYRAKDTTGEYDQVAIKVVRKFEMNSTQSVAHLHPNFKKMPKAAERANILKEVQIMRQIDHPNVVKLVQFSESRQYYYIVLELCPGGELFHQIVRLTYFSEELSRHVIVQVAKAIEYLHETSGVVHRDIKPENLLFYPTEFTPSKRPKPRQPGDEDKVDEGEFIPGKGAGGIGTIKIADFGLSKVIWDTQTMTPCGTVGYTAPEIVKDERYSKGVDMWALGCVLYTLLCGFPPFYDESIQILTEKVARGQYTFLSPWWDDISKSAKDLISHLLTVDPDERYSIKQFLAHPWIRETDEETQAASDAPPLSTPSITGELDAISADLAPAQLSAGDRMMDFRSPGVINLREVFDVGYAVHRQEEEGKRRKAGRGLRGTNPASAFQSALNPLNEDYDDDDGIVDPAIGDDGHPPAKIQKPSNAGDMAAVEAKMRTTNLGANSHAAQVRQSHQPRQQGYGQHSPSVAAAAKQSMGRIRQTFELSLDNATLLEKRGRRPEQPAV